MGANGGCFIKLVTTTGVESLILEESFGIDPKHIFQNCPSQETGELGRLYPCYWLIPRYLWPAMVWAKWILASQKQPFHTDSKEAARSPLVLIETVRASGQSSSGA